MGKTLQYGDPLRKPTRIKEDEILKELLRATYAVPFLYKICRHATEDICNTRAPGKWKVLNIFTAVSPRGLGFAPAPVSESYFN